MTTRYLWSLGIVQLEVADTGCGIPPEEKDRLFEPYFSTKKEGTGLGLAIVATIVADHQAFIRVHDNDPQGSRFIIELPVRRKAQRTPVTVATVQLPLLAPKDKGRENGMEETILVVDDEEKIRTTLRGVLSDEGFRVLDTDGTLQMSGFGGGPNVHSL